MTLTPKQRANLRAQIQPLIADEVRSACEAAIQQHLKHTPATPSYTDQILAGSRGTPPTTRRGQLPKGAKVFARLGLATALGRGDSMATREAARIPVAALRLTGKVRNHAPAPCRRGLNPVGRDQRRHRPGLRFRHRRRRRTR